MHLDNPNKMGSLTPKISEITTIPKISHTKSNAVIRFDEQQFLLHQLSNDAFQDF